MFENTRTLKKAGVTWHPRQNEHGQRVEIKKPSQATPESAWHQDHMQATVIPGGPMPAEVHGVSTASWNDAPQSGPEWEALAALNPIHEPELKVPAGYRQAAGVVQQPGFAKGQMVVAR